MLFRGTQHIRQQTRQKAPADCKQLFSLQLQSRKKLKLEAQSTTYGYIRANSNTPLQYICRPVKNELYHDFSNCLISIRHIETLEKEDKIYFPSLLTPPPKTPETTSLQSKSNKPSSYQTSDIVVKTPSFSDSGAIHRTGNKPLLPFL